MRKFEVFVGIIAAIGGIACTLQWLEIRPRDLAVVTLPQWGWLVAAIVLFASSLYMSGRALYLSTRSVATIRLEDARQAVTNLSDAVAKEQGKHARDLDNLNAEWRNKCNEIGNERDALKVAALIPSMPNRESWDALTKTLQVVAGQNFAFGEVLMDGKRFVGCTFENVSLNYNGTAPCSVDATNKFDDFTANHLGTKNPSLMQWTEMLRATHLMRDDANAIMDGVKLPAKPPMKPPLVIHYAGWGRGPGKDAYADVTVTMGGFVKGSVLQEGVKASDIYFGHHYGGEPRRLRIDYSFGDGIKNRTVVFTEHQPVVLPEMELL